MSTVETPTVPRDHLGRYMLRPPTGGERKPFTRVTTVASALDDRRALEPWFKRCVAVGLVERLDLYTLIASQAPDINDKSIDGYVKQAEEAARSSERANLGTALHRFCERVDKGTMDPRSVPEPYTADIAAYLDATQGFRWQVMEEVVVLEELGIAGMPDRIGYTPDGQLIVADIKTGKGSPPEGHLIYGFLAFSIQCALYAHADSIYDIADDTRLPMPRELDKSTGVIIHLPAGEGRCELHDIDLARGWTYAQLALDVMRARAQQRSLGSLRYQEALTASVAQEATQAPVEAAQPAAPGEPVLSQRAVAYEVLQSRGTGPEPDETRMVTPDAYEAIRAAYEAMPPEHRAWVTAVISSSKLNDVPPSRLHLKVHPSIKRFEILRGLMHLADAGRAEDEQVRNLLTMIDPVLAMPAISLGAALSVLTTDEAIAFSGLSDHLLYEASESMLSKANERTETDDY